MDAALELVREDGLLLATLDAEQRRNVNVVKAAVAENGHAIRYASEYLRNDISTVLTAVSSRGRALQ